MGRAFIFGSASQVLLLKAFLDENKCGMYTPASRKVVLSTRLVSHTF